MLAFGGVDVCVKRKEEKKSQRVGVSPSLCACVECGGGCENSHAGSVQCLWVWVCVCVWGGER